MRVLIRSFGYVLDQDLRLRLETGEYLELKYFRIVHLCGEGSIDLRAVVRVQDQGTALFLHSSKGTSCTLALDPELLRAQVKCYQDLRWRVATARNIVYTAYLGKILVLLSLDRDRARRFQLETLTTAEKLRNCTSVQEVRDLEQRLAKTYFRYWREVVPPEYEFTKRTRRPPRDVVSAVLSYLNTVLYQYVTDYVLVVGLSPWIGYLHRPHRGRVSLALDLAELLKPLTTEYLTLHLAVRRELRECDWYREPTGAVLLSEQLKARLQQLLQYQLQRQIRGTQLDEVLLREVEELRKCILEHVPYRPVLQDLLSTELRPERFT